MTDPREPSQMERVQQMLLAGPVCATTFLAAYMSSARSRVAELRAAGWAIESATCDLGHNHQTRQIAYRLVHGRGCLCPRCGWDRVSPGTRTMTRAEWQETFGGQMVLA